MLFLFFGFLLYIHLSHLRHLNYRVPKFDIWRFQKQMDRVGNFRKAGTGGVRNRVRSFFVWFLGLLDLLARSWCVPREHMIMFLGRAREEGIFLGSCGNFTQNEEGTRERERKEARSWASGSVGDQETPASTTAISHLSGDI